MCDLCALFSLPGADDSGELSDKPLYADGRGGKIDEYARLRPVRGRLDRVVQGHAPAVGNDDLAGEVA